MLPKQTITFEQLTLDGFSKKQILALSSSLEIFPTPFKGIYYVPLEEERKGAFIEKPLKVLSQAIALFLGTKNLYFTCQTAEEILGLSWQPSESIHIVNSKLSRTIKLENRIKVNQKKISWRAKKIAKILSFYGKEIVFHKGKVIGAKFKQTPYGNFALKSQIAKDKKRFREK